MRHFLALARTGSVRAAGAMLGVSHSTVARRVESLETRLGAKLFDRHRDGYLLTEAGHEMVVGAERVEREMAALERGLAGQDARLEGPVRVTCTDPFIAKILLRALAGLCAQHPGIELELDADARNLDLSKREADVALRAFLPTAAPPEHLIGRRLVPITLCNYVGRAHAGRLDPQAGPLRWLGSTRNKIAEELVASSSYPELPIWGTFDSMEVMAEAARAGFGVVMLPTYAGDADPDLTAWTSRTCVKSPTSGCSATATCATTPVSGPRERPSRPCCPSAARCSAARPRAGAKVRHCVPNVHQARARGTRRLVDT